MRTVVEVEPHDRAVKTALEAISTSPPVGIGAAPDGALAAVLAGTGGDYIVIHPLPGSGRDGTLGDPFTDIDLSYQFTVVGYSPEGVRWLADQIEPALLAMTVPGRAMKQVIPGDAGAVRLDEDVRPKEDTGPGGAGVYIATPRHRIRTAPSPT